MYDEEGHLNRYSIRELRTQVGEDENHDPIYQNVGSPIYSSRTVSTGREVFTARNAFGEGGERVDVHKIWMDDGEEEYKADIAVDMSARAMPLPIQTSDQDRISDWENLTLEQIEELLQDSAGSSVSWTYDSPWLTGSIFEDTLMDSRGLGDRYVKGSTLPNTYRGLDKCDLTLRTGSRSGDLRFFLMRKSPSDSDYQKVIDSNLVFTLAGSGSGTVSYAPDSVTGLYTVPQSDRVNGIYYIRLTDVDAGCDYKLLEENHQELSVLTKEPYEYEALDTANGPLDPADYPGLDQSRITGINQVLNTAQDNEALLYTGAVLNNDSIWMKRIDVRVGYTYNTHWHLKDFQERMLAGVQNDHTFVFRNDIADSDFYTEWEAPSSGWLGMLPARYEDPATPLVESDKSNVVDLQNASFTYQNGSRTVDPLSFDWFAGVYTAVYDKDKDNVGDYERYYAVLEEPTVSNVRLTDLIVTNTRIGIVNFHIRFDWKVGSRLSDMRKVTVQILADYHDGSEPHPVLVPVSEGSSELTAEIDIRLQDGVDDYFITNLPKYTNTGKIITYSLREVRINDMGFDENGRCLLDNDELYAEIVTKPYRVNTDSNSDNLMPVVITNRFVGETDFTINKIWKDDTNALKTRSDLYIQLWQHTTDPDPAAQQDTQIGKDYHWKKSG